MVVGRILGLRNGLVCILQLTRNLRYMYKVENDIQITINTVIIQKPDRKFINNQNRSLYASGLPQK